MKISTKKVLTNLKGENLKDEKGNDAYIGEFIANILISSETGGKMKMYNLATKFFNDKEIDLDASDLALVKTTVESTKVYTALVAGQILTLLEEIK